MKAKTKTETIDAPKMGCTNATRASDVTLLSQFVNSLPQPIAGSNNYVPDFVNIAHFLLSNKISFSVHEALYLAKSRHLPVEVVKELFEKFTMQMLKAGRLTKCIGCYDEPIFANDSPHNVALDSNETQLSEPRFLK